MIYDMEQERQLLKGSTPTLILAILRDQPLHGYAIAREIERRSENSLTFHDGTLYPALQQLERGGLIQGTWEPTENTPPRKVYRLTEAGLTELEQRLTVWNRFVNSINSILGPSPEVKPT
jgi:PadR family transcriptional regulator PadR